MSTNTKTNEKRPQIVIKSFIKDKSSGKLAENIVNTPLEDIAVNPFITNHNFSFIDRIKVYGFGSILFILRVIPLALCALLAAITASLAVHCIRFLNLLTIPTKKIKKVAKYIVFGILRCALFFGGFYRIKVSDKRGKSEINPTVIPIAPHTSYWDMIVLTALGAPAIVSRYENSKMFLVGSILQLCEPVYVKREDKDSRIKATNDIKSRALVGNIMLFPEGTCSNGTSLIQFKQGAFMPTLPVQPVVINWEIEKYDYKSWVEEGPGILKILFYTLGQLWIGCQITKLPPYVPNEDEKRDPHLFAENVEKVMCDELGVIQTYYSYDDVMFMGFANEIRIFRSPVCIKLLKICYRIAKERSDQSVSSNALSKTIKTPKFAPIFSPKYLGFGEDFEHSTYAPDFYIPKVLLKMTKKRKEMIKSKKSDTNSGAKRLPLSRVVRQSFDSSQTTPQIGLTSKVANEKRLVYEEFCSFVEKCINSLEEMGEIRAIESTDDLAKLLGLDKIPNASKIIKSSSFVDFLKTLEFSTGSEGPNVLHLLVVLHLCDCREPNLWQRIKAAINLLSLKMKNTKPDDKNESESESESTLNLQNFKTLLWYSLGLQQFNDLFFIRQDFDFEYVKNNMKRLFKRAVSENAESLE